MAFTARRALQAWPSAISLQQTCSSRMTLQTRNNSQLHVTCRNFSMSTALKAESKTVTSSEEKPTETHDDTLVESLEDRTEELKQKQARAPWHRENSDTPPVKRLRGAGAMVKGKLLTTPSRLLKLTLPLITTDHNSARKDIEPLALLVHPQQPLSYLERLIQSELPTVRDKKGNEKIPSVHFRAEDSQQDEAESVKTRKGNDKNADGLEEFNIDGKVEKTGVIKNDSDPRASGLRGGPGEGGVESYSGAGRERSGNADRKFVRWSSSTEVGDFIRDAARGKEFAVEIEGATEEIRVGVPSFRDRTHYLRQRLRRISERISTMASVKNQCDRAAHRAAQRIAMGGFAGLVSWWGLVYYLTFKTDLGWDVMEPVTYLVGLSGLMGGYLFFLYHNREVSYRSALNMTISTRQIKLYKQKGFDLDKWHDLVQEGNELRKEIKVIADEYDVEWSEQEDVNDRAVTEALRKEREKSKEKKDSTEDEDDSEDDVESEEDTKKKDSN